MAEDRFPVTRISVVAALAGTDAELREAAWEALARAYWRPVYVYLRFRFGASHEDAEDLVQGFFARAHASGYLADFDPTRARFRTYLRLCLDRFVSKERAAASRQKRGGGLTILPLDLAGADRDFARAAADPAADPELAFQKEWVRALFSESVEALRARSTRTGRGTAFALFVAYDLDVPDGTRPTYDSLGRKHGVSVTQVTNHLAAMRREFRREVLERLRTMTGSEAEFRAEARELLGWDPA
ncbi:MAG: hypothetical protein HOP28_01615 [Gemmatimonadales bacterium]|nr:hypothetical protein [Gemmatimonadales bacterium]